MRCGAGKGGERAGLLFSHLESTREMLWLLGAGSFPFSLLFHLSSPTPGILPWKVPVLVLQGNFHVTDLQDHAVEQDVFYSLCKARRKLIARAAYNGAEKPFQTMVIYMLEKTTVLWFN